MQSFFGQYFELGEIKFESEEIFSYKGLYNDLNQYFNLFLITEKDNEYYVGGILLKDFDFSYVSKKVNGIIDNSYFDEIRGLY